MAILQNRMSTEPIPGAYLPPDDIAHDLLEDYEAGTIALSDPSGGQRYQTWILTYSDPVFTLTPQTVGPAVPVLSAAGAVQIGVAFDQNGRETICYNTATNGFLYWWDSSVPGFVTTDLGTEVQSLALTLDDKRNRQTQANDILLWYTLPGAEDFDLFVRYQRTRYTEEHPMWEATLQRIIQVGMNDGTRVQVTTSDL
jgi:hypothetical protein